MVPAHSKSRGTGALHRLGHSLGAPPWRAWPRTLWTVTYDIFFRRVLPGRTFDETLEEINAAFDPDADPEPMHLTDDQRAVWARILLRISQEVGPVTSEEYPYSLTLWRDGPAGGLQLDYKGDSAYIEIPYHHPGQAALPITAEAYRIARVLEEESGLVGYDAQVEQYVRTGDVEAAAAKLGGMSTWVEEHLRPRIHGVEAVWDPVAPQVVTQREPIESKEWGRPPSASAPEESNP